MAYVGGNLFSFLARGKRRPSIHKGHPSFPYLHQQLEDGGYYTGVLVQVLHSSMSDSMLMPSHDGGGVEETQ